MWVVGFEGPSPTTRIRVFTVYRSEWHCVTRRYRLAAARMVLNHSVSNLSNQITLDDLGSGYSSDHQASLKEPTSATHLLPCTDERISTLQYLQTSHLYHNFAPRDGTSGRQNHGHSKIVPKSLCPIGVALGPLQDQPTLRPLKLFSFFLSFEQEC